MRVTRTDRLADLLPDYERRELTHDPGSLAAAHAGAPPDGYRRLERRARIGDGSAAFARAAEAVLTWQMHRRAGLVVAARAGATAGATVVLGLGRPLGLVIPCRVMSVLDEEHRQGFTYGTLPDHPECGEESFIVSRDADGAVWIDIIATSRPGSRLVALGGPISRAAQRLATGRYASAVGQLASAPLP